MSELDKKYTLFLEVASRLNSELSVVAILYGSVGLNRLIGEVTPISDLDILIPDELLHRNFKKVEKLMQGLEFVYVDEKEHEFKRGDEVVAFASELGLFDIPNFKMEELVFVTDKDIKFRHLTPQHYLDLYVFLQSCEYRQKRKSEADKLRIKAIREYLDKNSL